MKFSQALFLALLSVSTLQAENWPAWRGSGGSGVATDPNLPREWSATENIKWKTPLPDRGNSTPIVWGNKVFVTQAIEADGKRLLLCLDRATGKELWRAGTTYPEKEESHETNPQCSASPVTDGERVVAWFGSAGVFCYSMDGKELWKRDLGKQTHEWGYAASPVLHKDLCYIHFGPGKRTFLAALNKKTGDIVWQIDMPEVFPPKRTDGFAGREQGGIVGSWSTPILINVNGRDELVISVPEEVQGLDPMTGKIFWRCKGLNPLLYTSPIYGDGVVVAMGGFMGTTVAVKPGGSGDVTATHKLWEKQRTKNRLGSGVIKDGYVYVLNTPGVAECIELKSGTVVWEERLPSKGPKSESWSNMTLAGDLIYVPNQSGDVVILKASPKFEVVTVNTIGNELTNGSLATSDGEIFIRTHQNLWCIRNKSRTAMK
ncbi:MAG: PQQ-binding-like beta-propeller repeat protein [Verrucomicrobiota bacterium]|nr:PQQ-binding-like beta-propeller repeat protein [Verrucomicrobiota bacterium]